MPIITADQLLYTLGKQVQWLYPHEFGSIIWIMGPLHIEMMFLNIIDTWLDGSGWSCLYEKSGINTSGKVSSFLKGSHVKRSRHAQQIALAALVKLAHQAYFERNYNCYDGWKKSVMESSNTSSFLLVSCQKASAKSVLFYSKYSQRKFWSFRSYGWYHAFMNFYFRSY